MGKKNRRKKNAEEVVLDKDGKPVVAEGKGLPPKQNVFLEYAKSIGIALVIAPAAWLLLSVSVSSATATEKMSPTEQLRPFVKEVVTIFTDVKPNDGKRLERRNQVMVVVHRHFDFYEMSKRVYGRQWLDLSKEQQQEFVDLFTKLLEHAYIGKIEGYTNQRVEFEKERIKGDLAEVQTLLIDKRVSLPISYLMINKDDSWMVFDVAVERVSIARNYRDQFQQILKTEQHEGLIRQLIDKLKVLEQK